MKNLKTLKEEILNDNLQHFYVFYGPDYGLRNHYIREIAKRFHAPIKLLYETEPLIEQQTGVGLFRSNEVYVIYGDKEFAKKRPDVISTFIRKLRLEIVILCFDDEPVNTTLYKDFNDHITYFPIVQDNIAIQFIESELSLNEDSKESLRINCENNYNNILLEANKIKHYAQSKNISEQLAYDELYIQQQLIYKPPEFHSDLMMNDILKGNLRAMAFWYQLACLTFHEEFWIIMESVMQDLIIAYMMVKDGRITACNRAWDLHLRYDRAKTIRDFVIPYSADRLLEMIYEVAKIDLDVKMGKLEKVKVLDYFMCIII